MKYDMKPAAVAVAIALSTLANATRADENEQEMWATVVTATRTDTRTDEVLSDVTVIDRAEIERLGQTTVVGLLRAVPSVQVVSSGGRGALSSVFIRGANPNQTLVLIDGERISSATVGTTALEHIPAEQIDHIEILRGPASSLYGADALGGVIQIFTRKGSGAPAPSFSLGYGRYDTTIGSVGYGGQAGDSRFSLTAGWEQSGGFSALASSTSPVTGQPIASTADNYNPDRDAYRNRNFTAQVSRRLAGGAEIGANLFYATGRTHFDAANWDATGWVSSPNFDNLQDQTLRSISAHASFDAMKDWKMQFRLGRSSDETSSPSWDPVTNIVSGNVNKTTQDQFSWQNDIKTGIGLFMGALDFRKEGVDATAGFSVTSRTSRAGILGYQGSFGAHSLQASARFDRVSGLESSRSGSIAYGYEFAPGWQARASAGTAFHAPTFADLYWPADPVFLYRGNPNLQPERARNKEVGLRYEGRAVQASLTHFDNQVANLIDFLYVPWPAYSSMANVSAASLKGTEFQASWSFGPWSLRGNFSLLNARNDLNGRMLQGRAARTGTVELRRRIGAFDLGAQVQGASSRFNDSANTTLLPGYAVLNLDARYQVSKDWSLFARADNVLDKHYELKRMEASYYDPTTFALVSAYNRVNTPGANIFVGVRYAPK